MAREITLSLALFCFLGAVQAQNLQLHFDPRNSLYGEDVYKRQVSCTLESKKRDKPTNGGWQYI